MGIISKGVGFILGEGSGLRTHRRLGNFIAGNKVRPSDVPATLREEGAASWKRVVEAFRDHGPAWTRVEVLRIPAGAWLLLAGWVLPGLLFLGFGLKKWVELPKHIFPGHAKAGVQKGGQGPGGAR